MSDSENTWDEHYGYTCYRPGTDKFKAFEVQPVPDISALPEHHDLTQHKRKCCWNIQLKNMLNCQTGYVWLFLQLTT